MRRIATRVLGVLLLLGLNATAAHAVQWPHAGAPDTLTIWNIENGTTGVTPHPVKPDTVLGIRGIITGFDNIPTGFGLYIQNSSAFDANGPLRGWQGIDLFSGSTSKTCFGFQQGDSVAAYGKIQTFQGENEIEGLDNAQATDDMFLRLISRNNDLPPPHIGTTAELKEGPFSLPYARDSVRQKWSGSLVQINGPLRVVRTTSPTSTVGLNTSNSFLMVDNVACPPGSIGPCDSVFVDGSTLASLAPPSVGTTLTAVRGIYNIRTRGYRIQLRNGNDIGDPSPVALVTAFCSGDHLIRIVTDKDVDPSSVPTATYTLGSFGSVLSASQVDGHTIDLSVSGEAGVGSDESVTVSGLVRASNGAIMTTPGNKSFIMGVLPITMIRTPSPDSLTRLAGCRDVSQYSRSLNGSGVIFTTRGTVTGNTAALYFVEGIGGGPRNALSVFAPLCPMTRGHQYLIVGSPQEFPVVQNNGTETEIVANLLLNDEGPSPGGIYPDVETIHTLADTTCDVSQTILNSKDLQFNVVKLFNVMVVQKHRPGQTFRIAGPYPTFTDTMSVDSTGGWTFAAGDSGHIVTITGIERLNFGVYRIAPRDNNDLEDQGFSPVNVPGSPIQAVKFAAFPNPSRVAKLAFTLPREANVDLGVFDLQGRQVASVLRGRMTPGAYVRDWTGTLSNGRAASSGVYFYRLKVDGQVFNLRGVHIQ